MFSGKQVLIIIASLQGLNLAGYWASKGPELPPFWPIALIILITAFISAFCGLLIGCMSKISSIGDELSERLE